MRHLTTDTRFPVPKNGIVYYWRQSSLYALAPKDSGHLDVSPDGHTRRVEQHNDPIKVAVMVVLTTISSKDPTSRNYYSQHCPTCQYMSFGIRSL